MNASTKSDRVLIIDDDIMSREVLTVLLSTAGSQVDTAVSGEDALSALSNTSSFPKVVLADVQMPGISGPELASALRNACPPETLLLAMSGSQPSPESVALFDGFLLKPFQPEALAAFIATSLLPAGEPAYNNSGTLEYNQGGMASHGSRTASEPTQSSNPTMSTHSYQGQPTSFLPASSPLLPKNALDRRIYRQLGATMTAKQLNEMYRLCLDDVRRRILVMRGLVAAHEAQSFIDQAHAIKGGCGMLGATELSRKAAELEKHGLEAAGLDGTSGVNPLDELAAACDRLERIFDTRT